MYKMSVSLGAIQKCQHFAVAFLKYVAVYQFMFAAEDWLFSTPVNINELKRYGKLPLPPLIEKLARLIDARTKLFPFVGEVFSLRRVTGQWCPLVGSSFDHWIEW